MDVAVLYSGGKDSTYALELCRERRYNIKYLLSVKPSRDDCYLYHFATVEHTRTLAMLLGYRHILESCDVADPLKEAEIVKKVVAKNPVDAVILGGTGLQETQIKAIRNALFEMGVEVFASHQGMDHGTLIKEMIEKGYDIRITQVAAEGLTEEWLGKRIDQASFPELEARSHKYGFHIGAEGGHYDTLVVDGPIFLKRFEILEGKKVMQSRHAGHFVVTRHAIAEKNLAPMPRV